MRGFALYSELDGDLDDPLGPDGIEPILSLKPF
jgi:hypothetical protein